MASEQIEDYKRLKEARAGAPSSDDKKNRTSPRGGRDEEDGKKAEKPSKPISLVTVLGVASAIGILGGAAVGVWLGSQTPRSGERVEVVEEEPVEEEPSGPAIDLSQGLDLALSKPGLMAARGDDGRLVPAELGMKPLPAATAGSREMVLEPEERRELTRPLRPRGLVESSLGSLSDTAANSVSQAGGLGRNESLSLPPTAPRQGLAPAADLPVPGTPDLRDTGLAASDQPLSLDELAPPPPTD